MTTRHLLAMAFLAMDPTVSWAQPPIVSSEFVVNAHTTQAQSYPSVVADAHGGFVVVWTDSDGLDGDGPSIRGQRIDASGLRQGPAFQVNTYTTSGQMLAQVAADANGRLVVVWQSTGQDGDGFGVFAQRFEPSGAAVGPEFRVNTYTSGHQFLPVVAANASGEFVVVWAHYLEFTADVRARRYDSSGTPQGDEFGVAATFPNQRPAVAAGAAGGFVVAWVGTANGVFAQAYDDSGAALGPQLEVDPPQPYLVDFHPSLARDPSGNFLVAWSDVSVASGPSVVARRYDTDGNPQGDAFRVNTYTTGIQQLPSVAADRDGGFVVAWMSLDQDGDHQGVFAQFYDANGAPSGDELRVNTQTTFTQASPAVAADGSGRFVVTWHGNGPGGVAYDIFGKIYASDLIFRNGFTSGDLAAWSASATGGGDLTVSPAAGLAGTTEGLQGVVDDTVGLYVEDRTPSDEDRYRARFYFDTNGFDPGEALDHRRTRLFLAFEEEPMRRLVAIILRRLGGAYSLRGRARLDDDGQHDTSFVPISDGVHFVELDWKRATGPDANDGSFDLWIDGAPVHSTNTLDNSRSSVDLVRLGALSLKTGASGTLYWDEFESRRLTYIGP